MGVPLRVFGHISDPLYWQNLQDNYSVDLVDYRGFLPTESLQKELGDCFGLLITPRWVEAFGNGAIEALYHFSLFVADILLLSPKKGEGLGVRELTISAITLEKWY